MADTPKVRFKGFTDAWEQRKMSSLCEFEKGRGLSKEDLDEDGQYPCILYGQLFTDYGMFINNVKSKTNIIEESFKLSESGDILIPRCDTTPDGLGRASSLSLNAVILGFDINILKIKNKQHLDSKFVSVALNCHRKDLLSKVVGNTVRHLENKEIKDISIEYPQEIDEQQKIGIFFQQMDNTITLHQRKCDEIKELKKYMLQKMFPQNGKKIPEIRFAGFTNDWEKRRFCDFTFAASERNKRDLPLEPFAITSEHGFIPQNKAHDDFGYMKNTDRTAYNIVKSNSFAYNPARINIGSIGYYEGDEDIIVSSLYEVFKTADYVEDRFLWHWLKSDNFSNWIERLQEGSVRMYFYYDKLCECNMLMPYIKEQKKIAKYFDNLDHLITLHQRKCDQLKEVKKFMLQNMFPQKG